MTEEDEKLCIGSMSCSEMESLLILAFLVCFAGICSGLTLGLLSLDITHLKILVTSGTPKEQKHAKKILPIVKRHHYLLVTLLFCNAIAAEAMPIFLDDLVKYVRCWMLFLWNSRWAAIFISVGLILFVGEILPQSLCSRYGLAIGANTTWLVTILMVFSFPVAYPVGKLLDCLFGEEHATYYRRAELSTLVGMHKVEGDEKAPAGDNESEMPALSAEEVNIIQGALDLHSKTVRDAMTPITKAFMLPAETVYDDDTLTEVWTVYAAYLGDQILKNGHSRIPIYSSVRENVVGVLLVKNLLRLDPKQAKRIIHQVHKVMRIDASMPLYDLFTEFRSGKSHLAVVTEKCLTSLTAPAWMGANKHSAETEPQAIPEQPELVPMAAETVKLEYQEHQHEHPVQSGILEEELPEQGRSRPHALFGNVKDEPLELETRNEEHAAYVPQSKMEDNMPQRDPIWGPDDHDLGLGQPSEGEIPGGDAEVLKPQATPRSKSKKSGTSLRSKDAVIDPLLLGHLKDEEDDDGWEYRAIGIITFEDVIEEIIQEEIYDEADRWREATSRVKSSQAFAKALSQTQSDAFYDPIRAPRTKSTYGDQKHGRKRSPTRTEAGAKSKPSVPRVRRGGNEETLMPAPQESTTDASTYASVGHVTWDDNVESGVAKPGRRYSFDEQKGEKTPLLKM